MTPEQIRNLRLKIGLTQPQMAIKLGVCLQTVSNLENGHYAPRLKTLKKLQAILKISDDLQLKWFKAVAENIKRKEAEDDKVSD